MNQKQVTLLKRLARTAAAAAVSAGIAFLAGPHAADLIPTQYQVLVVGVFTPALVTFEKWLRYGSDPGEGAQPAAK